MKKILLAIITITTVLLAACNRDIEEFRFKGVVVGCELCSNSQLAYILDIKSPESIGGSYTNASGTYSNAIIGYRSSRMLYQGDTIYGIAYFTKSYAALNCFGVIDNDLPEAILLSVDEEASE